VVGLVCIESTRRKDLGEALERRLVERAAGLADALVVARFRAWHVERFGFDVHFDVRGQACADLFRDVLAAARARASVVIAGPPGSGKQVIARWVHFEGGRDGPLHVVSCRFRPADRRLFEREAPELARRGTLLLDGLDRLPRRHQRELVEHLTRHSADPRGDDPDGPRWMATMQDSPADVFASGRLLPDLARRLERLQILAPSLARRREELPDLLSVLLERFAREEGVRAPILDDSAIAMLWRQPWEGNVRELENQAYQLVVQHMGESLDAAALEGIACHQGRELLRRLPSRNPDPECIRSALRSTRTRRGSINKTRAALYLGWDPDTLVARMKDLGLDKETRRGSR